MSTTTIKTWGCWAVLALLVVGVSGCAGGGKSRSADPAYGGGASTHKDAAAPAQPNAFPEEANAAAQSGPVGAAAPTTAPHGAEDGEHRREAAKSAPERGPGGAADRSAGSPYVPRPTTRPGLGTSFGETRDSRVTSAPFVRESSSPFAVASLFYDDAAGVSALTRRGGWTQESDNAVNVGPLTVRVLGEGGQPLPGTWAAGRHYVVGQHGQRYTIEIRNNTGARVEAIATVDGLDVIDGRAGSFSKRGYLVAPWSTVEIDGFRRSYETVAAFRFGSVRDSYAGRTGTARNVGVIGVAAFREAGSNYDWRDDREIERRRDADPFPGRFSQPPAY